jgi:hypothetical protein
LSARDTVIMESPVASAIWRMPTRFLELFRGCTAIFTSVRFAGLWRAQP